MLLFSVPERGRASINVGLRHAFLHSMESSRVLVYVHEMSKNWRIMVRQKMLHDGRWLDAIASAAKFSQKLVKVVAMMQAYVQETRDHMDNSL